MALEISVTLKGPGREDPWIVVRGDSAEEVQKGLAEIHEKDVYTATGRGQTALKRGLTAGAHLDATTTSVEAVEEKPAEKAPAKKAEPKQEAAPKEEAAPKAEAPKKKPPKPAWA